MPDTPPGPRTPAEIALSVLRVDVVRALENGASRQDVDRVVNEAAAFHAQRNGRARG